MVIERKHEQEPIKEESQSKTERLKQKAFNYSDTLNKRQ